jgi:hypothetical protein
MRHYASVPDLFFENLNYRILSVACKVAMLIFFCIQNWMCTWHCDLSDVTNFGRNVSSVAIFIYFEMKLAKILRFIKISHMKNRNW